MNKLLTFAIMGSLSLVCANDLKQKVSVLMPLNQSLSVIKNDGSVSSDSVFKRNTIAFTPDFKKAEVDEPRFIGGGLLLENGLGHPDNLERGTKNYLSSALASLDSADGLPVDGNAKNVPGLEGKGAVRLQGKLTVDIKYPHGGKFIFSFYAKNGELEINEGEKVLNKFAVGNDWQRCHVMLDAGKTPETTILQLHSAQGVELDAMMLEGVQGFYLNRTTPSTWLPGDTLRSSDSLQLPLPENFAAEGAISLRYTSMGLGVWNCLTSTKGWKPELSIDVRLQGRNVTASLWDKQIKAVKKIETGKEYSFILSWNDRKGELYLDGELIGEVELPPVAERKLPRTIAIGGSNEGTSPNIRAEGVIRDYTLWNSPLNAEEAAKVASVQELKTLFPDSQVINLIPVNSFGGEEGFISLAWSVKKK